MMQLRGLAQRNIKITLFTPTHRRTRSRQSILAHFNLIKSNLDIFLRW